MLGINLELLVIHGVQTWMYLAVPVLLYAWERLMRIFRSSIKPVRILKAVDYVGGKGVLALHMSKPDDFEYKSGQYMFINCAAVSPFEWYGFKSRLPNSLR